MWTPRIEPMAGGLLLRVTIDLVSSPLSYGEVLRCWQHDADFRSLFLTLLADSPFTAFRWETPPLTRATANRPFEFVVLDSPGLATGPDPAAFAEHFVGAGRCGDGASAWQQARLAQHRRSRGFVAARAARRPAQVLRIPAVPGSGRAGWT